MAESVNRDSIKRMVIMEGTREQLNRLYRPLDERAQEYIAEMTKLHGGFKIESGFYNGHYHKNSEGNYRPDAYPIPVISVKGLCDIEIDFDGTSITSKLSKEQIISFDWNLLGNVKFEVYGVNDFLRDYGDNYSACEISESVQNSDSDTCICKSVPLRRKRILHFFFYSG